jgi:hypothetical protein
MKTQKDRLEFKKDFNIILLLRLKVVDINGVLLKLR